LPNSAAYMREWRSRNKDKTREYDRKDAARRMSLGLGPSKYKQHGLSDSQYLTLLARGRCGICGATEPNGRGKWPVDHDHACCSGRWGCARCVRDILCVPCNTRLGQIEISIADGLVEPTPRLEEYLRRRYLPGE